MRSRPVAARASRTAAIVASVPLFTNRIISRLGMRRRTSSARRDRRSHEAARLRPAAAFQICHAVDVIGLPLHAADLDSFLVLEPVHEDIHFTPHETLQALCRDATLYLDDLC